MNRQLNARNWKEGIFSLLSPDSFVLLQKHAHFERLDTWYHLRQYDYSLFEALRLIDLYPDDAFGYVMAGNVLQDMCLAYSKYELSRYIHPPSAAIFSENFNELLRMFQRLSLEEMVKLTVAFVQQHAVRWESTSVNYKQMAGRLNAIKKLIS
jgi:hypothetical protein